MSQPQVQPQVEQPQAEGARELSQPQSQGHKKVAKGANEHGTYHPELSTTSRGQLQEFIRAPLTGKLDEIPGIGPANIAHFHTVQEEARGHGGEDVLDSSFQVIGKYMMLRKYGISNIENAQQFYIWLKLKGITSHANNIVEAVAEKVNVFLPGSYSPEDYMHAK